ncbi:acyl-CoA dehydrogenase C-terminal domain-containing protein [Roseiterribacter gracilis]|uniref:3-methylmercaptopropionyl-CoA dehydrogenase n=1 Tax=Roseiterribacter gracilis TaxID=2812848 RepID=A0A8S8XDV8_9PROT|nr:acyl-CoA dehydrogenase [Rhodospirillales bacterium TMPK1]
MPSYKAPIENVRFILNEVFDVSEIAKLPGYEDATPDVIDAVLEGMAQFCEEVIQPLNLSGDAEGCKYENGVVRTPKGFKEAYDQYVAGGWMGVTSNPAYGGQGLPHTVGSVLEEFVTSANMSFGMYPGLSTGAIRAIEHWAPEHLKQTYLHKMVAGTWSGTMCLTEAHCGTDLGLIRTKASAADSDGSHKITGSKIFISAGEQDLTENIIHLVLAKLPDAPPGVKGISLFIVPKFLPKEDGSVGPRNGVMCGSIEHKMGIKASATCVMNFDEAKGWLIGEPHKGMRAMFTMMNAARFGVAMQGLGIAEVSYQNAVAYAKDRIQGRALTGAKEKDKPADPIIVHPDVRKNLLTMKAFTEAARALSVWVGMQLDVIEKHPDPKVRQEADDLLALMTPILKAYFSDMGSEVANLGVQIYGGHGYIHEWGMEQFVRDARIAQIYEGANGIQALDLVGRKLPQNMGRPLRRFFHPASQFIEAEMENPALAEFMPHFAKAFGKLQQATAIIAQKGMSNPDEAAAASTDYLRMFALVAMAFMWLKMVKVAVAKLPDANGRASFYDGKIKTARFFFQKMLPETETRFRTIMAGSKSLMDLDMEQF